MRMKILKLFLVPVMTAWLAIALIGCSAKEAAKENAADLANAKSYPLDTCLVCGMKLSMMSTPVVFAYQGQQIKVCDATEKAEFEKDPAKYLQKMTAAGTNSNE